MEVIATSPVVWDLTTCHSWSILDMHTEFSRGRELLCLCNTFWRILLYSSGHVRLYYPVDSWCWWVEVAPECPRGRPSWCMTQTTLAHNKAGHRGVLLGPSVAACTNSRRPAWIPALSLCRDADHQTGWRHSHTDEDPKLSESLFRDKRGLSWPLLSFL